MHDQAPQPRNFDLHEPALALSESIADSDARGDQHASIGPSDTAVTTPPMSTRRNTYTTYSIGCAGVWGIILLLARRRVDSETANTLRLVCGGWWMGWTSATIARIGFPPPKPLTPAAEKRLRIVSSVRGHRAVADRARLQTRREDVSNGSAAERRGAHRLDRVRCAEEPLARAEDDRMDNKVVLVDQPGLDQ